MRKLIIIQKIKDPENYINIDHTLKNQSNILKPFNSIEKMEQWFYHYLENQ